jgi:hypothetical protein
VIDLPPPTNRRCQVYGGATNSAGALRCRNGGSHWEKWPGYQDSTDSTPADDFYSWECDGPCDFREAPGA